MEALLQHFHEAFTKEADVEQLKKLILQLAFQGKLVQQDPNDEPVTVLLQRIEDEKKRLVQEKKIKREKPLPLVSQEDEPYEIPNYWKWVRLGKVCNYGSAEKAEFQSTSTDCWILELEDIEKATSTLLKKVMVSERSFSSSKNVFYANDVLYGKLRPYLDKVIVADECGVCSTEILPIRGYYGIYPRYLMYTLKRPDFLQYIDSKMYGMKMPRLGTEDGRNALLPLPPYNEQIRIASRIEELFALCSTLKEEIKQKEQSSSAMHKSVFTRIQDYNNPLQIEELQFVIRNIKHLCNDKTSIDQLRDSLLSLAIQGKLVKQDPKEEPTAILLEKIKAEKEKLIKEKKIKKEKPLIQIKDEEKPFQLPDGWEWVRLGIIGNLVNYPIVDGPFGSAINTKTDYIETGIPVIRMLNVKPFKFISNNLKYISNEKYESLKRHNVLPRDVLFSKVGAGIGQACVVPDSFDYGLLSTTGVTRFRVGEIVLPEYLCYFLSYYRKEFVEIASKTAQPFLNMTTIKNVLFPLPPVNEQQRIVDKVNLLMEYCSQLERNIIEAKQESEQFLKAILKEAFTVKEEVLN